MIKFSVGIIPRGKGRPRATVRGGFARLYTDAETRKYEAIIAAAAVRAMAGRPPLDGPVMAVIQIRIPVPASYSKRRRAAILAGEEPYWGSGDIDNQLKSIFDACNGVVFLDDKQIVRLTAIKTPSENPGVDVRIEDWSA